MGFKPLEVVTCRVEENSPKGPKGTNPFNGSSLPAAAAVAKGVPAISSFFLLTTSEAAVVTTLTVLFSMVATSVVGGGAAVGMGETTATLAGPGDPSSRLLVLGKLLVLE